MKNPTVYFLFLISTGVGAIELSNGIITDGELEGVSEVQRESLIKISEVLDAEDVNVNAAVATTNLDSGQIWYSLLSDMKLYGVDVGDKTYVGSWPLTRWPHEYIAPQLTERLQQEGAYEFSPEPKVTLLREPQPYNGCLSQTPLRYGDVDSNTSKEVALFMNQDIILFSPSLEKTIFQLRWIEERYDGYYDDSGDPVEIPADIKPNYPQFNDPFTEGQLYSGLRAYAKMYVGEFNGNEVPDILVWHKLYESNMFGEPEGFSLVDEKFIHYELITTETHGITPTGEYLLLETSSPQVEQWLEDNELTWQSGFPNTSECTGQVDQHIPEMVDPLLNDSEVLE